MGVTYIVVTESFDGPGDVHTFQTPQAARRQYEQAVNLGMRTEYYIATLLDSDPGDTETDDDDE